MRALPNLLFAAAASIAAIRAPLPAQEAREVSVDPPKVTEVRELVRPMPFPPQVEGNAHAIEFRSVDGMSQKDRDLAAGAESSIAEDAGHWALEFDRGAWSYRQVVCTALPNHLFLRFTRNNGTGDVSMFTASIPRDGGGRVRIIPILRRGYSLFSPAPVNKLTVSAFNGIREEEHAAAAPDWLGAGLCYAALAGSHPQDEALAKDPENPNQSLAMPPVLEIPNRGGAVIRFTDLSAARPMAWTMTFDGKGRLLKAAQAPASLAKVKDEEPKAVDTMGKPWPPTGPAPAGVPVP